MGDNCNPEKYNVKYTIPYNYKEKEPNNCCNGQFNYPKDVNGIIELDNFSIRNDQRQIEMYVRRIQCWKPEHRKQLLALLTN